MLLLAAHTTKFLFLSLFLSLAVSLFHSHTHTRTHPSAYQHTHALTLLCASWYTTRSQYTKQSKPALFQRISFSFSWCPLHSLLLEKSKKSVVVISSLSPLSLLSRFSSVLFETFSFAFSAFSRCVCFSHLVSTPTRQSTRRHLLEILSVHFYLGTLPAQKNLCPS